MTLKNRLPRAPLRSAQPNYSSAPLRSKKIGCSAPHYTPQNEPLLRSSRLRSAEQLQLLSSRAENCEPYLCLGNFRVTGEFMVVKDFRAYFWGFQGLFFFWNILGLFFFQVENQDWLKIRIGWFGFGNFGCFWLTFFFSGWVGLCNLE